MVDKFGKDVGEIQLGDNVYFMYCGVDETHTVIKYDGRLCIVWGNKIWDVELVASMCSIFNVDNVLLWGSDCCPNCGSDEGFYVKTNNRIDQYNDKHVEWCELKVYCSYCGKYYDDVLCFHSHVYPCKRVNEIVFELGG